MSKHVRVRIRLLTFRSRDKKAPLPTWRRFAKNLATLWDTDCYV